MHQPSSMCRRLAGSRGPYTCIAGLAASLLARLRAHSQVSGGPIILPLQAGHFADALGFETSVITQALMQLSEEGCLNFSDSHTEILDHVRLAERASGCCLAENI